jgi:BirA family biotin operon repressor/biotin-[acetyl-CoA-carboxylase] ligase
VSELQEKILAVLNDGGFHSGEALGSALGVSRTAVWKQLQKLATMGLPLESIKGTGYRLAQGFELLAAVDIRVHLSAASPRHIDVFHSLESTNTFAREQAAKRDYAGSVVFAERQTAGRGRRGKEWLSPFGASIYMSVLWDFEQGAQALQGLSLGVGVAVRRALLELGLADVSLKWPNDIYVKGKKLGGILLEMVGDPEGHCSVVIGIGINVSMPIAIGQNIDQPWTDLDSESLSAFSRNKLAASLIDEIFTLLADFETVGFSAYRDEWESADAFSGLQCAIITPRETVSGVLSGVDNNGAVRLRLADGSIQRFIGGELSLRQV